jgi:hypothetical protein
MFYSTRTSPSVTNTNPVTSPFNCYHLRQLSPSHNRTELTTFIPSAHRIQRLPHSSCRFATNLEGRPTLGREACLCWRGDGHLNAISQHPKPYVEQIKAMHAPASLYPHHQSLLSQPHSVLAQVCTEECPYRAKSDVLYVLIDWYWSCSKILIE